MIWIVDFPMFLIVALSIWCMTDKSVLASIPADLRCIGGLAIVFYMVYWLAVHLIVLYFPGKDPDQPDF